MNRRTLIIVTVICMLLPITIFARPSGIAVPEGVLPLELNPGNVLLDEPADGTRSFGVAGAANRVVDAFCKAACGGGGWPWGYAPFSCPSPANVPPNLMGTTGTGMLHAYLQTGAYQHLVVAFDAGDYSKCYSFPNGEYSFASYEPFFQYFITHVYPRATSYQQHAETYYFGELDLGTYGPNDLDTAGRLSEMWDTRIGQENIRTYDVTTLLKASYLMGTNDQFGLFANQVYNSLEDMQMSGSWEVLGLASGIFSLAFAGIEFDPVAGPWSDSDNVFDLADTLTSFQHPMGGFLTSLTPVYPSEDDSWTLETGYWHSGAANGLNTTLTKQFTVTDPAISFDMYYNIEADFDFAYVEYSTDGSTWFQLPGTYTDPARNEAIHGCQETVVTENMSFPAPGTYYLRFRYLTDGGTLGNTGCTTVPAETGFYLDNITVDGIVDTCDTENGWIVGSEMIPIDLVPPEYQGAQETAYAVLALKALDPWRYSDEIDAGIDFLWNQQLASGGFELFWGMPGYENVQVDGETLWGITYEPEPWNDGDVDNDEEISPGDSQLAFQIYLGDFEDPSWQETNSSDCDGDGKTTPDDANCIWKHFLGYSCHCVDPIIITPPRITKYAPIQAEQRVLEGGVLYTEINNADGITEITLSADKSVNALDAFGLHITIPDGVKFLGAEFGYLVKDWPFLDAQLRDGTLIVGGFDPVDAVNAGEGFDIVTLKFQSDTSIRNFKITKLYDDLSNFRVQRIQSEDILSE